MIYGFSDAWDFHQNDFPMAERIRLWEQHSKSPDLEFMRAMVGFMPTFVWEGSPEDLTGVLVATKLSESRRAAREVISGGAVTINARKVTDPKYCISREKDLILKNPDPQLFENSHNAFMMIGVGKCKRIVLIYVPCMFSSYETIRYYQPSEWK
jgi:tyrosyl-tRNA synthetase